METSESFDLDKRTKVSRACDYCKKRKFKCSGKAPCDLCLKKKIDCTFSIVDRRTIRRKNKKRKVKAEKDATLDATAGTPSKLTIQAKEFVHKVVKTEQVDKKSLNMLKKPSQLPIHFQPLTMFPVVGNSDESDEAQGKKLEIEEGELLDEDESVESNSGESESERNERNNDEAAPAKKIHNSPNPGSKFPDAQPGPSWAEDPELHRVLFDGEGNLKYVGESAPLSFLFECRSIFSKTIGKSEFTEERESLEIFDDAEEVHEVVQMALPNRSNLRRILRLFYININEACYVFDIKHFEKTVIAPIYNNYSECSVDQISLMNLMIGVGLLYAEIIGDPICQNMESPQMKSSAYFEFGIHLAKKYMNVGKLWITEAMALAFFYYSSTHQRSTAWLILGIAVRNAQGLGLHRKYINESFTDKGYVRHRRKLFKSLYVLDRITSVTLGRPLLIDDYDWDDFGTQDIYDFNKNDEPIENFHLKALIETTKVAKLIGKIIRGFYLDGIVNTFKAEKLAVELKQWALNLPEELQMDKAVNDDGEQNVTGEFDDRKISLLLIHLSHLYTVILLSRPFYMYIIFTLGKTKIFNKPKGRQEIAICNFCRAAIKASSLIVQLMECYINYTRFRPERCESNALISTVLMASLIIGMTTLFLETHEYKDDTITTQKMMIHLNAAKRVLQFYSKTNIMATRYYVIMNQMQNALMEKFNLDVNGVKRRVSKKRKQGKETRGDAPLEPNNGNKSNPLPQPPVYNTPNSQFTHPSQPVQQQQQQKQQRSSVASHISPSLSYDSTRTPTSSTATTEEHFPPHDIFNKDYDNFMENFGTLLLPMATMGSTLNSNQGNDGSRYPVNKLTGGNLYGLGGYDSTNLDATGSNLYNQQFNLQEQPQQSQLSQLYAQQPLRSGVASGGGGPSDGFGGIANGRGGSFSGSTGGVSLKTPNDDLLDEFMYNVGLNDFLYDARTLG